MVFVPFTGIDHHKKSITFASGLLANEDVPSYTWLLEAFLSSMGRQPDVVVTDQDPSLKIALPIVFDKSHRRFCMWHIMDKLTSKVLFNS